MCTTKVVLEQIINPFGMCACAGEFGIVYKGHLVKVLDPETVTDVVAVKTLKGRHADELDDECVLFITECHVSSRPCQLHIIIQVTVLHNNNSYYVCTLAHCHS